MISSFRLGLDGWVYATHGFSNTSHFAVRPENLKSQISNLKSAPFDISSGSVFRFKPDGSQVELWTSGQVNPFGLCWDSWGNLYSADCHSSPIYQLIRGATYPQFGKQPDALGFGPVMCEHAHGSTGICGPLYIDGGIWGTEWDDHMFVCNPVTSKINHDLITFTGSTPKANEKPDFLTSDDPWFRPVDLQLGSDSALYIADFYNRIIGHYEVPLDHPGRDRSSGRIWRVVKKGSTGKLAECDLAKMNASSLRDATKFGTGNLTRAMLAASILQASCDDIVDRRPPAGVSDVPKLLRRAFRDHLGSEHGLDVVEPLIANFARIPTEDTHLRHALRLKVWEVLSVPGAFAKLSALSPDTSAIRELLNIACAVPSTESANWLLDQLKGSPANKGGDRRVNGIGGSIVADTTRRPQTGLDGAFVTQSLTHIARHLPAERQGELVDLVQKHFGDDLDTQLDLFAAVRAGTATLRSRLSENGSSQMPSATTKLTTTSANGIKGSSLGEATVESRGPSSSLDDWAARLAKRLTDSLRTETVSDWQTLPPSSQISDLKSSIASSPSPWFKQMRKCADGSEHTFLCSLPPGGEKLTGTLRSKAFDLPKTLTFWIAGHRGPPKMEAHEKNFIRFVDEDSGAEIAKAYPPRNDVAQQVTWELSTTSSKRGHLEITDGDDGTAYAWLAVGGFSPEVVGIPELGAPANDKRIRAAAELAATWGTHDNPGATIKRSITPAYPDLAKRLNALPNREAYSPDTRVALARLCFWAPLFMPDEVAQLARDNDLVKTVFSVLEDDNEHTALAAAFKTLPSRSQIKLASALASSSESAKHLFKFANPIVLADPLVSGKLNALNDADISKQLKAATASLPPQNDSLNKLIAQRLKSFDPAKADAARGQDVFMRTCSVCHRIGVKGNLVGPQLDGVGARGAERLIEDILDPNRAVDPAFRLHIVKLKSGGLMTGLLRREQDDDFIFCDAAGQEHNVNKSDVAEDQVSLFSLMPSGLGEVLKEQELHDLMGFLLQRKS